MKTTNKLKVIAQAFLEGINVPDEVHQYRMDICKKCEYNSINKDTEELSLFQRLRKKSAPLKAFCTHCSCYIKEKTGQSLEQCDLDVPKWNKYSLIIENSTHFNLINVDYEDVNLELIDNEYIVHVGKFDVHSGREFNLELQMKDSFDDKITVYSGCSLCTFVTMKKTNEDTYRLNIIIKNISIGELMKRVYVEYKIKGKSYKSVIKIKGDAY